ncbi:hypothetical protein OAB63_02790 [Alphaproteobacteria bacterium]|nr:hypothetical protein [Alphaproteobacteria bacterium]
MIENFNGYVYFIIFLIILVMNIFYGYNCIFNTKKFLEKYAIDVTAAFFGRFAGSFILGTVLMQLYILFRGVEGTWAFFNFVFIVMTIIAASSFYTQEIDKLGLTDKSSKEGYISTGSLAILWGILCFGLSDKIYI